MTIRGGDIFRGDHNRWLAFGFILTADDRRLIKIVSLHGRIREKDINVDRLLSEFELVDPTMNPDALVCYTGSQP